MHVDKETLLFEDLYEHDVLVLKEIDRAMRMGHLPWDHSFVIAWFDAYGSEKNGLLIGSTVMHIRVLQSIVNYVFKNGWIKDKN